MGFPTSLFRHLRVATRALIAVLATISQLNPTFSGRFRNEISTSRLTSREQGSYKHYYAIQGGKLKLTVIRDEKLPKHPQLEELTQRLDSLISTEPTRETVTLVSDLTSSVYEEVMISPFLSSDSLRSVKDILKKAEALLRKHEHMAGISDLANHVAQRHREIDAIVEFNDLSFSSR